MRTRRFTVSIQQEASDAEEDSDEKPVSGIHLSVAWLEPMPDDGDHLTKLLIGGELVAGDGKALVVENPFTTETIVELPAWGESSAARASRPSRRPSTSTWSRRSSARNGGIRTRSTARGATNCSAPVT
jgi:hypothetical protein